VDADGNSSSWDRYLLIGHYGGVPIRFENLWQECWHSLLVDGENCVVADRHSLAAAVERLRANPDTARRIAANAGRTAAEQLSRPALLGRLAATLGG
jgi:glycosyltransferase involved in cell wall biosynthesis